MNAEPSTLVVVPGRYARVLALAFYLNPDVQLQMLPLHGVTHPASGFSRALLLASDNDAAAYGPSGIPLQLYYRSTEQNAQIREFRGSSSGQEYLSLWRFKGYTGTPP